VVHRLPPTDDPHRRKPNADRALRLLNWSARTLLEQALSATVQWFRGLMLQPTVLHFGYGITGAMAT
jgi:nucleoside-diphosphate-sugar epimerase